MQKMREIPDASVNLVLTDPPYGTTYAKWDEHINIPDLWRELSRILAPGGCVVMTSSQPFTSRLVVSNPEWYRCEWVWDKANASNFANASHQPLKTHENILVFAPAKYTYNPQKVQGKPNNSRGNSKVCRTETLKINTRAPDDFSGMKHPKTVLSFPKHASQVGLHPTQKPVDLMRYLVRTYSNEGDTVLDPYSGSGSTLVASALEDRRFIGIDRSREYCDIAEARLYSVLSGHEDPCTPRALGLPSRNSSLNQ